MDMAEDTETAGVEDDNGLPRIRTYADDLSDEIRKKGTTLTSIVGAERERSARELALADLEVPSQAEQGGGYRWYFAAAAVTLVVAGIVAVVAAIYFAASALAPEPPVRSIIFPNSSIAVAVVGDRDLDDQLAAERDTARLSLGEIGRFDITVDGATTTPRALLEKFDPPAALLREVKGMMIGVHSFNYTQPFIIIEVTQYDRAYSAMLGWEEELGRALGTFYRPREGGAPPTMLFVDKVYRNIDTRQSQSEWPILYAFPRRDLLVITTNEATLQEILTRLAAESTTSAQQ